MDINILYDTGMVRRCHTVPDYSGGELQTLAHHCWGVALLAWTLAKRMDLSVILLDRVLTAALIHDAPEYITGDLPATAKWAYPDLADAMDQAETAVKKYLELPEIQLTPLEQSILKWADSLELYAYAQRKVGDGCKGYRRVLTNVRRYMLTELEQHPAALTLMQELTLPEAP